MASCRKTFLTLITACFIILLWEMSSWIVTRLSPNDQTFVSSAKHELLRFTYRTNSRPENQTSDKTRSMLGKQSSEKLILAYTKMYGNVLDQAVYGRSMEERRLIPDPLVQCSYKCRWSTDLTDYNRSDAVLFHLFAGLKDFIFSNLPTRDNTEQKWVLMAREPQSSYYPEQLRQLEDKFNLTVSFQYDSDVVIPYGHFTELSLAEQALPAQQASRANRHQMKTMFGKSKTVAWLVSNCITSSRREEYVRELQKYIPIDIYGKCGNLATDTQDANIFRAKIEREYKFYIAFENSDCDDYLTEKFWHSLTIGLIPIVRGHRANYKRLAPPNSYIHTDTFMTPKQLAEHINNVSTNITLFNSYHDWRRKYVVRYKFWTTNDNWMCDLCEKVHSSPTRTVDFYKHFSEDTRCFTYLDQLGRNRTGEHVQDLWRM